MTNLRDKIADMLTDADTSYAKSGEAPSANELADAILALPEIADLTMHTKPKREEHDERSPIITR